MQRIQAVLSTARRPGPCIRGTQEAQPGRDGGTEPTSGGQTALRDLGEGWAEGRALGSQEGSGHGVGVAGDRRQGKSQGNPEDPRQEHCPRPALVGTKWVETERDLAPHSGSLPTNSLPPTCASESFAPPKLLHP